jgi:hypothetical protein
MATERDGPRSGDKRGVLNTSGFGVTVEARDVMPDRRLVDLRNIAKSRNITSPAKAISNSIVNVLG